jgi:hypothetical protein
MWTDVRMGVWETLTNVNLDGSVILVPPRAMLGIQVYGVWNGATITVQGKYTEAGSTYFTLLATSGVGALTADGGLVYPLVPAPWVRVLVSGAGAATDLDAYVFATW